MSKESPMTTSRASLCALGEYLKRHCFFAPLQAQVQVPQKTVRYRPIEQVLDGLLGILCGAKTLSQSNSTMRVDPAVQRACGRTGCAEQSTMARTLQASTAETVDHLSRVSWYSRKRSGQPPHHRFAERRLWVDMDVTPLPRGAQAEGSARPWMGRNRSKTGRKTLRCTARVVYLYRAGNSGACKTGIMPLFHHHGRGQRDGIIPLFLPVGAVGAALAVLHVACCLAQQSRRKHTEAPPASLTTPQAPPCPEALSWPHPQAPLRCV